MRTDPVCFIHVLEARIVIYLRLLYDQLHVPAHEACLVLEWYLTHMGLMLLLFPLIYRTYLVIPELTQELEVWQSRQGL